MKNLYKSYILFFTVTIPQIIIFSLFYKIYEIIGSELTSEVIKTWIVSAVILGIFCLVFTTYGVINSLKKKEVHPFMAIAIFAVYLTILSVYFLNHSRFIPNDIPTWLFMGIEPGMSLLTLTMPALAYSMLIVVHWTIEKYQIKSVQKDVLMVVGIPFFWYVAFHLILGIIGDGVGKGFTNLMPILFILSASAFFFFLVRVIYMILSKKAIVWKNILVPIVIIGSLLGLLLNQAMGNIFGDFSHYSFYILAIITSLLMMLPEVDNIRLRLIIFIARSITYIYSLYFFFVFLPYLPLSLVAIIVFGAGLLMLVPLVLMLLHTKVLLSDFISLSVHYKKSLLAVIFIISILSIPTLLISSISDDRVNMDKALRYTYQRSFSEKTEINIDLKGVKRAIANIKHLKNSRNELFNFRNTLTPYLSAFYNWYVLDNVTIADSKIKRLEEIYLGAYYDGSNEVIEEQDNTIAIKQIDSNTIYNQKEEVYKSWIDLELQNTNDFQGEFVTNFELPEGSYISDYYLNVNEEKKYGMIADKRAANWVYNQNKIVRRDPGVISNIGGNQYELKIFPFASKEIRKTGLEITHTTPITLKINGRILELNEAIPDMVVENRSIIENDDYVFIPKEVKNSLEKVTREPEYYFVIDSSIGNKENVSGYINRIEKYIESNDISDSVKEIVAVNYNEKSMKLEDDWSKGIEELGIKGGFNLDYTIKRILYENYTSNSEYYPVIIVSTNNIDKAVLSNDFDSLDFTCSEGIYYYQLTDNLNLNRHSLLQEEKWRSSTGLKEINYPSVMIWHSKDGRTFYLSDNQQDSIIILNDNFDASINELNDSKWANGVMLETAYLSYLLHPEKYYEKTTAIVKSSISSKILSPLTSFIVLENQAQEKAMLQKQKELLATNKPVDVSDMMEMNEPSIFLIAIPLIGILIFIRKRSTSREHRV